MTKPTRKDGKQPNTKKDALTASAIKALYQKGIPSKLLSQLYNCAESTVVMLGVGARQANIQPMNIHSAVVDMNVRFKSIVDNASAA
ncbi:hypothetical protein [Marinomonas shanghaiensis]|uniref:hypothetical protein n=1 Tax=Marinomonas shanghaiensis TaxID=2202418 RepID=UPI003A919C1D